MKSSKKLFIIVILLVTLLILSSCQKSMQEPEIKISYNSEELKEIYYFNINNEKQRDIEQGVKDVMVGKRFIDLTTVSFGEKIEVEALNFETKEMEIYDYIVDERGYIVSAYDVEPFAIISVEEGKGEFIFEKDDYLESHDAYKVEGKSIHLLLIRCKIDNSSFAFGTLVLEEKWEGLTETFDGNEISVENNGEEDLDTIGILIDNTGFLIEELGEDETLKLLKILSSELKKDMDYKK